MRILLSAYACEPHEGSEPGVGWHWALELARLGHEVTVLTQAKNRGPIERGLAAMAEAPPLRFLYFDPPAWIRHLKRRPLPLQLYHPIWQYLAYRFVRTQVATDAFDLCHHLTFCTIRQPSFMGALGLPFVLGPVGGGERAPLALRSGYGLRGWLQDGLRDLANLLIRVDPITRRALEAARVIYVSSEQTRALVPAHLQERVAVALQVGIDPPPAPPSLEPSVEADPALRLLYAGRFLYWKGMHLGLEALASLLEEGVPARLTMVGAGPDEHRLRRRARKLGIEAAVDWLPWQPQEALASLYRRHHALLFPSLHDSAGTVALESLASGLPVVCLDLGGPGTIVDAGCGRVIETEGRDRAACVAALAAALRELAHDRALCLRLRKGARRRALAFRWPVLVAAIARDIEARLGLAPAARGQEPAGAHG